MSIPSTETPAAPAIVVANSLDSIWGILSHIDFAAFVLLGSTFYIAAVMIHWHVKDGPFDFRKALLDPITREISFSRLGHFVCLVVSTSLMCFEAMKGRLTEWLFIGYMTAWAGTYVAAKAIDKNAEPPKQAERRKDDVAVETDRRKPD